jgi:hypothetical protein
MAEKGLPEQTIMAQVGRVSPQMLKTYSHIRGKRSISQRRPLSLRSCERQLQRQMQN